MGDTALANMAGLELRDRLRLAVEKTLPKLPADAAEQLKALLSPEAIAVAAAIVIIWAGLHFTGIGEIADVVMIITAWVAAGALAWQAAQELFAFAADVSRAKSEADLDDAANHLARAISLIGVQAVLMLLLHTAPKPFASRPGTPRGWWNLGPAPRSPQGRWFYRPTTRTVPPSALPPNTMGTTSVWGDIEISSALPATDARATLLHEQVHAFLTPKLYPLRELRVQIAIQGYERSIILRYLEEAFAETYALLRTRGLDMNTLIEGFTFPLGTAANPSLYNITLAGAAKEVAGVLFGPVNVGGTVWKAWLAPRNP